MTEDYPRRESWLRRVLLSVGISVAVTVMMLIALWVTRDLLHDSSSYWTNYDAEVTDDGLLSLLDSTFIPYEPGFDAVIRARSNYWYVESVRVGFGPADKSIRYRALGEEVDFVRGAALFYNQEGHFTISREWTNDRGELIRLSRFGSNNQIQGDCVGWDDDRIYVKNARRANATEIGSRISYEYNDADSSASVYRYNLEEAETTGRSDLECKVWPSDAGF